MQNKKMLMAGAGVLAVAAVVGVAVTFNQGGLFKGALTVVPVDYTSELEASGQKMDSRIIQVTAADGVKYTLFSDKKLFDSQSLTVDNSTLIFNKDNLKTAGFGNTLYMKWVSSASPVGGEPLKPSAGSPYPKLSRLPQSGDTAQLSELEAQPLSEDQMRYVQNFTLPVAHAQTKDANAIKAQLDKSLVFRLDKLGDMADGDYVVANYKDTQGFARFAIRLTSTPVKPAAVSDCINVDRIAFSPEAITYQEGGNTSLTTDLSAYVGTTNVGLPMDNNNFCKDTWTKLNLAENMPGLSLEIIESSGAVVATDTILFQDGVGPSGYSLFNGFLNVGLVDAGGKAVMRFTNDFTKKESLTKGLEFGKQYLLNLRGTKLKDPTAPKSIMNMVALDQVAARYSMNLSAKAAASTQPPATSTSTTSSTSTSTTTTTKPSSEPCIVDGKTFYLAQGPNSSYCKDLQALGDTFKSDQAPETPQVRYTTAIVAQRILSDIIEAQNLDARIRVKNLSADWYKNLRDAKDIASASSQEQADFKNVYAAGVLKGRRDPATGQITLAPLERIKYIELLSLLKQSFASVIGYTPKVSDSAMPAFAVEYKNDANKVWMYEAVAFGIEFNIITKDEFNATTIQGYAQRSDMASFLKKFKDSIENNPSLLEK